MAEDLISSIIDTAAIERQVKTVFGYLETLKAEIKSIQIAQPDIKITDVQQLAAANNNLNSSLQSLNQSSTQLVSSQSKLVQMQQQLTTATQANTASLQENIQARIRVKNSLDSYLKSQAEDLALLKAGTITRAEYNKRLIESNVKVEQYKNQLLVLNKEIKTQTLTTTQQGGAYAILNKEYQLAQTNAKNLAVIYGIESKEAKAAAASALALNTQLQAIDKTVGLSQRNVGNYGGVFQKAFSGLRTLANIIPGIGISGLLLFAIEPITEWINKVKEATGDAKLLNDTLKEGAKGAADQVAILDVQKSKLNDLNISSKERKRIAEDYNKTAADGNKINVEEINNLTAINEQINKQIGLIERQSLAKAAQAQISKFAEAAIQAEFDLQSALSQSGVTEEKVQSSIDARAKKSDQTLKAVQQSLDGIKVNNAFKQNTTKQISDIELVDKKLELLLVKKKSAALELDRVIALLRPQLDGGATGGGDRAGQISDLEKSLSTEFEVYKKYQQLKIEVLKDGLNNDKIYYLDKLRILEHYVDASEDLITKDAQNQIKAAQDEAARQIKNLEKDKQGKSPAQVARINENIAIIENNLSEKIQEINANTNVALEKLGIERVKNYQKIQDDQLKVLQDFHKDEADYEQQQVDAIAKIRKAQLKAIEDDEKKKKDLKEKYDKQKYDLEKQLAKEAQDTIFAIIYAGIQKQQDALDEKQRLLEESTKRQIDDINLLGGTEEERTRKIAQVQKEAQIQSEQIEQRKRELSIQRAKFEKAESIASIITSTAQAVVAALGQKPYSPANISIAALVGSIGALQLARAISTPIPKYAKGTDSARAGFAIAGEIGSELVTERSGAMYLTPATPTLMHFKGGEKITPANLTNDILNAANLKSLSTIKQKDSYSQNDINNHLLEDIKRQLVLANRKPGISIHNQLGIETTETFKYHFKR